MKLLAAFLIALVLGSAFVAGHYSLSQLDSISIGQSR